MSLPCKVFAIPGHEKDEEPLPDTIETLSALFPIRPWRVMHISDSRLEMDGQYAYSSIYDNGSAHVFDCDDMDTAEFIVLAVNSFESLVDLCQALRTCVPDATGKANIAQVKAVTDEFLKKLHDEIICVRKVELP